MKMLFLTDKFPPSEGGSRIYYYNLCKNYPPENVVVLTKKVEGYQEFDRKQAFKIIRKGKPLPNWKYSQLPRGILPLLWSIYLIIKERIDVIHCGDFFPGAAIGLILKKIMGKPFVYYVHEKGRIWYSQYRFQPKFRKIILRNADRIVAACSYAEQGVKEDLDENKEKVFKITPGVDFEKFKPDPMPNKTWQDLDLINRKVILTIGRLVERKGQDTVIRAMPIILREVPDAVYLVAGRGPHELVLRRLVEELNVQNNVRFLGFVRNQELPKLYGVCDLFVMINRETAQDAHEGFGMVFTEASASGKPVIGGKSGGTGDSIVDGFTGYRVDPYNVDEVAACIIKVLKDPELARTLGRNGREWVVKNCDWREKAKQLEAVNRSIIG